MKAAVIHQFKDKLEIKQLDKPTISSHEVLVKVHACGVCHTDLHAFQAMKVLEKSLK
jgi:propanol-preferring alcohol dehydrogenase